MKDEQGNTVLFEEFRQGMPELIPFRQIKIHFKNQSRIDEFSKLIDQSITPKTEIKPEGKVNIATAPYFFLNNNLL